MCCNCDISPSHLFHQSHRRYVVLLVFDKMSGQGTTQRVYQKSSPSSSKNGPMRAILPMSSLMRHGNNMRKSNSPNSSPMSFWRSRVSPEYLPPSGQRSPGSSISFNKGKSKSGGGRLAGVGCAIRRTASLDTIYLKSQLPPEGLRMYCGHLLVDKATQTSDDWVGDCRKSSRLMDSCGNEDKLEKYIRHKLQRGSKDGSKDRDRSSMAQSNPIPGDHSVLSSSQLSSLCSPTSPGSPSSSVPSAMASPVASGAAKAIPIPGVSKPPVPRMRNSIEGLNQEIERLVLKGTGMQDTEHEEDKACQATPEGHRAPLAEMLRSTRSVNTQTPAGTDLAGSTPSSGPPSCGSMSPLVTGLMEFSRPCSEARGGSPSSSPEHEVCKLGTSPHINKFLAREPPDGCEKVSLKFVEETRRPMIDLSKIDYCPLKPSAAFQLRPSVCSAFQPLCRTPGLEEAAGGEEETVTSHQGEESYQGEQTEPDTGN